MYIAIVDMDQPGVRNIVGISNEDQFSLTTFNSIDQIEELKKKHSLSVFDWWVLDMETGHSTYLIGKVR